MKKLHYKLKSGFSGEITTIGDLRVVKLAPFEEGLLAWWKHDEGSGTTLNDYQEGNNGTIRGSNFWSHTAPDGNPCGYYQGYTESVNSIGTGLGITGSISIMVGLKIYTLNDLKMILTKERLNSPRINYRFYINSYPHQIRFFYNDTGGSGHTWSSEVGVTTFAWRIFTMIYTYGMGNSFRMFEYDGAESEINGSWAIGNGNVGVGSTDGYVQIGSFDSIGDDSGMGKLFQGNMGDILLFNKYLSSEERARNYNVLKGRYNL